MLATSPRFLLAAWLVLAPLVRAESAPRAARPLAASASPPDADQPSWPGAAQAAASPAAPTPALEVEEATVAGLQAGMAAGRFTARRLAEAYLARIAAVDPKLRSVLEVNPDALAIADALDAERREKGPRGPLHGIPVLLKDNVATADRMETTAGSLALLGVRPPRDAFLVGRLRAAGAVILGKTNLSEWANIRSSHSSSGWSARGGQTRNPYALDRNPCGSSSGTGVAVAANLVAVGVGTETDGSIVCPSSANGLVGVKPTVGLVSRPPPAAAGGGPRHARGGQGRERRGRRRRRAAPRGVPHALAKARVLFEDAQGLEVAGARGADLRERPRALVPDRSRPRRDAAPADRQASH